MTHLHKIVKNFEDSDEEVEEEEEEEEVVVPQPKNNKRKRVSKEDDKDSDEDGEKKENVVVEQKPARDTLPKKSESGIPFVHALKKNDRILLEAAKISGRAILIYHKPKVTHEELLFHIERTGLKPLGIYRLNIQPYKFTGNVDTVVFFQFPESVSTALDCHWKTFTGGVIEDSRAWLMPGFVMYIRGFPRSAPDAEIIGFCTKKCGEVLWIKHIDPHDLVAVHFAKAKSLHIAKRFEKRGITYNGNQLYAHFRVTTKGQQKRIQTKEDKEEHQKLKKLGALLLNRNKK